MKKKIRQLGWMGIFILVILGLSKTFVLAEPTIDDIQLGKQIMGEPITKEDLKDHVVFIEMTGLK